MNYKVCFWVPADSGTNELRTEYFEDRLAALRRAQECHGVAMEAHWTEIYPAGVPHARG